MGGTFDPIHFGHLFVAEEARVRYRLDRVVFVTNGTPPHKKDYPITAPEHRYAMVALATRPNTAFECSAMELNRPGPSYTVETLTEMRGQTPAARLFYITGVDAIADILTWRRHAEVIQLATFIAAARPGFELDTLRERLPEQYLSRIEVLQSTFLGISSTEIRRRIAGRLPARYLTTDDVLDYIERNKLYRQIVNSTRP